MAQIFTRVSDEADNSVKTVKYDMKWHVFVVKWKAITVRRNM